MKKYVILTDSSCDLNKELREKYDIEYVTMRYIYDNVDVPASLDWEYLSAKDFYDKMRQGVRFTTSQITAPIYEEAFEKYINEGCDVLYLACSSALSGSYKASLIAKDEVLAKFPERKIICVDALRACMALGILCITASKLRAEGKTIEEVAEYIENNKMRVHMVGSVEDLTYLKRAGRVSAMSAVFGGLLNIKPIIIADTKGQNNAVEKVKGRNASLRRITEYVKEHYREDAYQHVAILHADCEADCKLLINKIKEVIPDKNVEFSVNYIGPAIGASVGPGMISAFFVGNEVTV